MSLTFVRGIHRSPVNSAHKGTVTRKMFPFDDVTMVPDDGHQGISSLSARCSHVRQVHISRHLSERNEGTDPYYAMRIWYDE